jgi:outer membrane murein-binding lipoprotein Lpp
MNEYKMIIGALILVALILSACDDFFTANIEIFNIYEKDNSISVESKQELNQKEINI